LLEPVLLLPEKQDQQNPIILHFNKGTTMKLLSAIIMSLGLAFSAHAQDAKPAANKGEKKEVCTDAKDKSGKVIKNKDGTVKQSCATIKVRKKYEATKVPGQK
jgi:hypothetical protein